MQHALPEFESGDEAFGPAAHRAYRGILSSEQDFRSLMVNPTSRHFVHVDSY